MSEDWTEAAVELNTGYTVLNADGEAISYVPSALVALQGGFAKLRVPGTDTVQVVSAPAVHLITLKG
ncbi:hypothetical protein [Streptomyces rubellomurinus]|uniref:Uncharacterized protein n=2 Tax=Streptomyces TaxID=1883 RepID=A0A0F2TPX2_STRR3|nr:hypothetical protein [Streptomyces rubellomurinus]KJS55105.1 hypothetical protein VM98_15255 [Streptomyces rubellomurinus subsp. indigoferus]KJS63772.1 hypothetical protein VM95_00525 [Streptomyces rubellomurinus]